MTLIEEWKLKKKIELLQYDNVKLEKENHELVDLCISLKEKNTKLVDKLHNVTKEGE